MKNNFEIDNLKLKIIFYHNFQKIIFIFIFACFLYFCEEKNYDMENNFTNIGLKKPIYHDQLINENFFIIDSNNLENVTSHMYGYSISKKGFLTDNYYKNVGYYEKPDSIGSYVMVRINGNEIIINQDYHGSFGLYLYKEKNTDYFAISNSFLFLEEYLVGKKYISFNKDFADNFILSWLCTPSIYETMIKEIERLASNSFVIINIKKKRITIKYIDYMESSIPLESKKGLKLIDKWADKWTYIIRSIKKVTDNFSFDLSGGFDSRAVLAIFLSSGIDTKDMPFISYKTNSSGHIEDYRISTNISSKFGFKINKFKFDLNSTRWSPKETLFCSLYTKLGLHKEFYWNNGFMNKPRISFTGGGGEFIRGSPASPINNYIESLSFKNKGINGHEKEFYFSSMRLCKRSVNLLKKENKYNNDYEISSDLYSRYHQNHFGKKAIEGFIANYYFIQPLIDPDLRKIKYNISGKSCHDLITYIYARFAHDLIYFPFEGNRVLNLESIKKAEKLNNLLEPYIIKSDFNSNFYLDIERKSPAPPSKNYKSADQYIRDLFKTKKFIESINKIYDINVYNWVKERIEKSNYFPLRHGYGLLSIFITIEFLSLNKKYNKNSKHEIIPEDGSSIINNLIKDIK